MKKHTFLLVIASVLLWSMPVKAQKSNIYHRVGLKLGHSTTPKFLKWDNNLEIGNVRFEGNYGINNFIEVGGYLGCYKFWNIDNPIANPDFPGTTNEFHRYQSDALFYGVNANFHVMPFLVKRDKVRIDLYLSGKLGAISMIAPAGSVYSGTALDYGLYAGLAYYITKSWGLYVEYGLNRKVQMSEIEPCLRYGVTVKF